MSARTQAESLDATAQAEAKRELGVIRAEVDRIGKRRDAIAAQLASLRDVVAGFASDDTGEFPAVASAAGKKSSGDDKAGA